jgi:site-specific DNA recombinase
MVNTAIYTRISQDTAGTGLGVARQEEACRAKAKVLGWNVVEVYTDNDISASKDKARPAYDRLLADIANGTVDGLVVYDLDRLTRKPAELESFIDLADKHSIKLANVSGDVDLSNANGRMIARIKQRQQAAAMGKPAGSRYRTFGYDKDWNVIEAEAKIVREMFKRYVAGNSVYSIKQYVSKQLNNINPVTGKEVIYSTVAGMLKNPRYAGYSVLNGQIVGEATYPAIIDKATFNAAADIWNATPLRKPKGFNARKYLLGGLVYCGKCNARMSGQKNNRGVAYYSAAPPTTAALVSHSRLSGWTMRLSER